VGCGCAPMVPLTGEYTYPKAIFPLFNYTYIGSYNVALYTAQHKEGKAIFTFRFIFLSSNAIANSPQGTYIGCQGPGTRHWSGFHQYGYR
jgi:hypothetical protein